ncbi:MAG: winged helix-turn-helix transcriptional regulator [Solirubrobacteraceae bacterium]
MSLIDEVRNVEERVIARLRELGPAVAEYQQLLEVAERLGIADRVEPLPAFDGSAAPASPAPAPSGPATAKTRGRKATARKSTGRKTAARPSAAKRKRADAPSAAGRRAADAETAQADDQLPGRIVAAVAAEPGITVADLSGKLDVAANLLYRPVRRLTDDGALTKRGRGLHPAAG